MIDTIKTRLDEGMSVLKIAKELDVTPATIYYAIRKHGLVASKKQNQTIMERFQGMAVDEILKKPLAAYETINDIADELGASKNAVRTFIKHLASQGHDVSHIGDGNDHRKVAFGTPPFDVDKFACYVKDNTIKATATHFNIPYHHVKKWCRRFGIDLIPYHGGRLSTRIEWDRDYLQKRFREAEQRTDLADLGLGHNKLKRIQKEMGLVPPPTCFDVWARNKDNTFRHLDSIKDELVVQHNKGTPLNVLSETHDVNYEYLKAWWHDRGLVMNAPQRSKAEIELCDYLTTISGKPFINTRWEHDGVVFEIDCYNDELKFGVEFNGIHWHSGEAGKKHSRKQKWCMDQGIRLFSIFEHDWLDAQKQALLKSMLQQRIGVGQKKTHARSLTFTPIGAVEANRFFDKNHMAGGTNAAHYFSLKDGQDIITALSLAPPRFGKGHDLEVIRYATKQGHVVVGGLSRLLANARKIIGFQSLMTYVDLRYGWGESYKRCGFATIGRTERGYQYLIRDRSRPSGWAAHSRHRFQKHKLKDVLVIHDPSKTESENMEANGYLKVYDCGHLKMEWIIK